MTKQISPLRQRMLDDMTSRNMSPATQRCSTYAVPCFFCTRQIGRRRLPQRLFTASQRPQNYAAVEPTG
jgi:hypothetical protein